MGVTDFIVLAQAIAFLVLSTAGSVLLVFLLLRDIGFLARALIAAIPSAVLADGADIAYLAFEYGEVDIYAFLPTTLVLIAISFPIAWIFSLLLERAVRKRSQ